MICTGGSLRFDYYTVNAIIVRMEFIKAEIVGNDKEDYQTGTDTNA